MNKIDEALEYSRFLCKVFAASRKTTLTEVARKLGISVPRLSRIIHLREGVGSRKLKDLLSILEPVNEEEEIVKAIQEGPLPFPHLNNLLSRYPLSLYCILYRALERLRELDYDYLVSVEGGGLILASLLSAFTGKRLLYGIKEVKVYGSQVFTLDKGPAYTAVEKSRRIISFPLKVDLTGSRVVVVDGIVWSGSTIKAMVRYVRNRDGAVVAVLAAFIKRDIVEDLKSAVGYPIIPCYTI
ncbi:phosphoribosyltransferase [Thermogladius sp. 4427co]|uniref:phosphoribosyltransferase n=1 Tax=Thermogladius sp. 4427co TaxID=3450718 RepID=UPI003F7A7444